MRKYAEADWRQRQFGAMISSAWNVTHCAGNHDQLLQELLPSATAR